MDSVIVHGNSCGEDASASTAAVPRPKETIMSRAHSRQHSEASPIVVEHPIHRYLMAERLKERTRIARELHDTLLQTVQGMLMLVEAGTRDLPRECQARARLEQALKAARMSVHDTQRRICSLRCSAHGDGELTDVLRITQSEFPDSNMALHIITTGEACVLPTPVREELAAIGREAIRNAYRHSGGTRIVVELTYGTHTFGMRISDDGRGIDMPLPKCDRTQSWGMWGIRERALSLGARLYVKSSRTGGTAVGVDIAIERKPLERHG
jgi:signal transduction histidine kinase